jgi:hypothetical protein
VIVDVDPSDVGFHVSGCGTWSTYRPTGALATSFGPGAWVVNDQIAAGTYTAHGNSGCYWERESSFSGELSAIKANDFGNADPIVTISSTDVGFKADKDCGSWSRIG